MKKYKLNQTDRGYDVIVRKQVIGTLLPTKEKTGRHCFYLSCDTRKNPRTYRGRYHAAAALYEIHRLSKEAQKKNWPLEQLIVRAWDGKVAAVPSTV